MPQMHHLIIGDGAIGRATALALRQDGQDVVLASRGSQPAGHDDVPHQALDALTAARCVPPPRARATCI